MLKKDKAKLFSALYRAQARGDGHKTGYKKSNFLKNAPTLSLSFRTVVLTRLQIPSQKQIL